MSKELILQLLSSGGVSIGVYWFLSTPLGEELVKKVAAWTDQQLGLNKSVVARVFAMLGSALVGTGLYALIGAVGWVVLPVDLEGWLNVALMVSGVAYTGSQAIHAKDLGKTE
jgi:hypothetical protein